MQTCNLSHKWEVQRDLAGEVNVSISSLEGLNTSLVQTLPMLDRLVAENESITTQTLQKIELMLDNYTALSKAAHADYQQAVADLDSAERIYEDVPDYYYRAVNTTEREHNRLLACCKRIKEIKADFNQRNAEYQKSIAQHTEYYSLMVGKGNAFVEKYIEVLNRSNNALNGGSSTESGVSGTGRISNNVSGNVQSIQSVAGWLGSINPKFNGDPYSPFSSNCGSCAAAVYKRLSGDNTASASIGTLSIAEMNAVTGKTQTTMSPDDIKEHLVNKGAGSFAVIGVDRASGAGHWFNAYYDGKQVYAIDGQTCQIHSWPPNYGNAINWDISI